jgi:hypothetical protein
MSLTLGLYVHSSAGVFVNISRSCGDPSLPGPAFSYISIDQGSYAVTKVTRSNVPLLGRP